MTKKSSVVSPKPSADSNLTVRLNKFGDVDAISLEAMPKPDLKKDEVLVRIVAAGVNPADYEIRHGEFQEAVSEKDLPTTLGYDLAGIVEELGAASGSLRQGDEVFAFVADHSGQAQYAAVKSKELVLAPKTIDAVHAAAVPLAAITAWQGLFDHGGLTAGQTVLIHGGAGGLGHFAIQFAKVKGATVYTTCSENDLDFVRELGADKAIDYKDERFEEELKDVDVDIVFDLVGGETNKRSYQVLREGGVLVSTIEEPDAKKADRYKVKAVPVYTATPSAIQLREVASLIDAGRVKVVVSRTFPLEQVREAQEMLETGHVRGKIVLMIS